MGFCGTARVTTGFVSQGSMIVNVTTVLLSATTTAAGDLAVRVTVWAPAIAFVTFAVAIARDKLPAVAVAVIAAVIAAGTSHA